MSTKFQNISGQLRIRTRMNQQTVSTIYHNGAMVPFVIRGGKIVHAKQPIPLPQTAFRLVTDAEGEWFEVGFLSAHALSGNAVEGYTDPDNYLRIVIQNCDDMVNWEVGNFIPCPTGATINNGDGTWWYWARSAWPRYVKNSLVDFDLRSTRGNKSITALNLFGVNITLPGFPYAVETAMPTLQTHLRNAGYTNAIASYTPAPYTAEIARHFLQYDESSNPFYAPVYLRVVHSGETVTEVRTWDTDTLIPLPAYPYALPSQAAALQTALINAGQSGSVVRLFAGEWRIFLPNRASTQADALRVLRATFKPNDPFPRWSDTGAYQGLINDNTAEAAYSNLRTSGGATVRGAAQRQFVRLQLQAGSRSGTNALVGSLLHWLKQENL